MGGLLKNLKLYKPTSIAAYQTYQGSEYAIQQMISPNKEKF